MRTARVVTLASAGLLIALCVPGAQGTVSRPAAAPAPPAARAPDDHPPPPGPPGRPGEAYPASYRCATVAVPLDYARPSGPTLHLKISRLNTSVPCKRHGVLLTNSGGPRHRGLDDPLSMKETLAKKVRDRYVVDAEDLHLADLRLGQSDSSWAAAWCSRSPATNFS